MSERYGAENERSAWMRFHTQTAGVSLTPQQPLNNLTRVALQALAAVLGGTQSLHTDAYDEALAVPTAEAALLALRQQQIIAEESGVDATVDPLGGSWFVEALTDETERQVWRYLDEIDRRGGMVAAITEGYPQREVADAAYRYQREFDAGQRRVVGINAYVDTAETTEIPVLAVPEGSLERHMARLERTRRERDAGAVEAALAGLRDAATRPESSETNLMPHFIRCAAAYATLGSSARSCARSSVSTANRWPSDVHGLARVPRGRARRLGAVRGSRRSQRRAAVPPGRRCPRLVRPSADGSSPRLAGAGPRGRDRPRGQRDEPAASARPMPTGMPAAATSSTPRSTPPGAPCR